VFILHPIKVRTEIDCAIEERDDYRITKPHNKKAIRYTYMSWEYKWRKYSHISHKERHRKKLQPRALKTQKDIKSYNTPSPFMANRNFLYFQKVIREIKKLLSGKIRAYLFIYLFSLV
jgi:hypothetical protein